MAKHTYRKLTPKERARSRRAREAFEADKADILAKGQEIFERHERLLGALRMLKSVREAQGVSLSQLAERTGIAKSALSRLENDPHPNPTVNTLMRIASALGHEITIRLTAPNEAA